MGVYVGLIRAIGPVTHRVMSMTALRASATAAGLEDVATVLATGNLVFRSSLSPSGISALLRRVIDGFGLGNDVVLRTPDELAAIVVANPFAEAAAHHPSDVAVCFLATASRNAGWLAEHPGPERLLLAGQDLYVDYPTGGVATKLPPGTIERRLGVVMTARNWNTVTRLLAAGRALEGGAK